MKTPTLGDLIMNLSNTYGIRRASGIFRLMIEAHWVLFRGYNRHVLSKGRKA